jgi:hypothetical protein
MFDVQANWPAVAELIYSSAFRAWLVAAGVLVAGHYHAMAAATRRAPFLVKYAVLPMLTGSGVGMIWAGATGDTAGGGLYSAAAAGLMVTVNLSVWASGAYVSAAFDRAAEIQERIKRSGHLFVADIRSMADAVNIPDSEAAALEKERERQP